MSNRRYGFGLAGIATGGLCLAVMVLIEVFGPGSYTSSGSALLFADGTVSVIQQSAPLLPRITQAALYASPIALVLSGISVYRKENHVLAWAALVCGLIPVWVMTIGPIVAAVIFFCLALPAAAIALYRCLLRQDAA